jgi:hypothetical protein
VYLDCPSGGEWLLPSDVLIDAKAPDGWAGAFDAGIMLRVDARITEELRREGIARDLVRQVQDLRKKANLNMEDRIALHLGTDAAALRIAIDAYKDYIANETLTVEWPANLDGDAASADVKIDGQPLAIKLRPVVGPNPASAPGPKKAAPAAKPGKPKVRAKRAATKTAGKPPMRSKPKPKADARSKTSAGRRKKAKPSQTAIALRNSKPSRAPKKPPKPKSAAKVEPKKTRPAGKGVKKAARPRKK